MNEQLEELFGKHFNGLHYEDITKEMMFQFAIEYANIKVEAEKQIIREYLEGGGSSKIDVYEWIKAEMMATTDITLDEFEEVLQMWISIKKKELSVAEFEKNYR